MFLYAGRLLWAWGAGASGVAPPAAEGPYWVSNYHCITPRCYTPIVRPPVIEPGRRWAEDPTLQTFAWDAEE